MGRSTGVTIRAVVAITPIIFFCYKRLIFLLVTTERCVCVPTYLSNLTCTRYTPTHLQTQFYLALRSSANSSRALPWTLQQQTSG